LILVVSKTCLPGALGSQPLIAVLNLARTCLAAGDTHGLSRFGLSWFLLEIGANLLRQSSPGRGRPLGHV
jgi:hypothetical protein